MKYTKRRNWKYKLYETEMWATGIMVDRPIVTEFLQLGIDGLLVVKPQYAWDGASGPTFDTKNTFLGSLIHDALYQLMREGYLDRKWRKRADEILYEILRSRRMTRIRARTWYRAVRKGAAKSSRWHVLTAP